MTNNIDEVMAKINEEISKISYEALQNEVEVIAKDIFQDKIITDGYNVYEPRQYKRTQAISNMSNIKAENIPNGIKISNIALSYGNTGVNLLEVWETGGDAWSIEDIWGYGYSEKRYPVERTIEVLKNDLVREAMIKGLRARGINCNY